MLEFSEHEIRIIIQKLIQTYGIKEVETFLTLNANGGHGEDSYQSLLNDLPRQVMFQHQDYQSLQTQAKFQTLQQALTIESSNSTPVLSKPRISFNSNPLLSNFDAPNSSVSLDHCRNTLYFAIKTMLENNLRKVARKYSAEQLHNLTTLHLEILEATFHQTVGQTPLYILNNLLQNVSSETRTKNDLDPVRHLYYDANQQTWILNVNASINFMIFAVEDANPERLSNPFSYVTISHLGPIPYLFYNPAELNSGNYHRLKDQFRANNDGFVLNKMIIEADKPQLELFNSFLTWKQEQKSHKLNPNFLEHFATPLQQQMKQKD